MAWFRRSKRREEEEYNLIDSLAGIVEENHLKLSSLSVALPVDEDNTSKDFFDRHKIHLFDGSNLAIWHVDALSDLFRGEKQPPQTQGYPEEYIKFFYLIEKHVITACDAKKDVTDSEFVDIYSAMRRRPDGKSSGLVHDVVWQCAALGLGLQMYSQPEYEAIFGQLVRSARHWKMGHSSRNYIAYLRENF